VQRAAEVFGAAVMAIDGSGCILAGARGAEDSAGIWDVTRTVRAPFALSNHHGEVVVEQMPGSDAISPRLLAGVIQLLINQILMVESLPNQQELKNRFISQLLHGTLGDDEATMRESQILGMNLLRPRAVMLIDASEYIAGAGGKDGLGEPEHWLRAQSVIRSIVHFFSLPSDAICAYIGQGEIAVLKASSSRDLNPWAGSGPDDDLPSSWSNLTALKRAAKELVERLARDTGTRISMGIGRYHKGLRGLARSYEDARTALSIGRRFDGPGKMYCLDELGMPALVAINDDETRLTLAQHLLGPLENEPELLETLDVFFRQNCSVVATAAQLFVHRNTLNYRLEKIASLTGLDPRRFDEAMLIRFALLLLRGLGREPLCNRTTATESEPRALDNRPMQAALAPA